jgi:GAF domain-containing protein
VLKAATDIVTDFGRIRDLDQLTRLLGRAAEVMDASGLMVWIGSAAGDDLRPVLAHGYSEKMIARIPPVSRSADNAAAAAYRSGTLQIVLSHPGGSSGAVVAPILAADGCIGALSAEIRSGGETSDSVQALAAIFAAQLAGVMSIPPAAEIQETRAAANS